jgi:hypothetical protein
MHTIQERDVWLLEATAKLRFVQTADLAKLYFADSTEAASKRVRKLAKAGLMQVWEKAHEQKHVYTITRAGLRTVATHDGDDLTHVTPPKQLDGNLEHVFTINYTRIALALNLPEAGGALSWWRSDWELRAMAKHTIVPDALFGTVWEPGDEQMYALEVEQQTRAPRNFLKKILAYAAYKQTSKLLYGLSDFLLLVVVQGQERLERYRRELGVMQSTEWLRFATVEAVTRAGGLMPIWQPATDGQSQSLQDLATLPDGRTGVRL